MVTYICFVFFFQAEDGIRDLTVTGVQTCALPISCPQQPTPRGGLLIYTATVSNPGNVTLTNIMVSDSYEVDCFNWTNVSVLGPITLAPGASTNFSGSYTAPRACCEVLDTLTATGQD